MYTKSYFQDIHLCVVQVREGALRNSEINRSRECPECIHAMHHVTRPVARQSTEAGGHDVPQPVRQAGQHPVGPLHGDQRSAQTHPRSAP